MKKKIFKFCKRAIIIIILGILSILAVDYGISLNAKGEIFTDIDKVPQRKAALVLGTIKHVWGGRINQFYSRRLKAAAELYKHGKIDAIIVSGDNSRENYDEPSDMKNDLIEMGIPSEHISCDYAGFRTLDSVVRAKEIFDCDDYIIVSQRFHCERALFIAGTKDHKPVAYCAEDVSGRFGLKVRMREVLARCKAVLDCYIINKEPKFYGPKVKLNSRTEIASTKQ